MTFRPEIAQINSVEKAVYEDSDWLPQTTFNKNQDEDDDFFTNIGFFNKDHIETVNKYRADLLMDMYFA